MFADENMNCVNHAKSCYTPTLSAVSDRIIFICIGHRPYFISMFYSVVLMKMNLTGCIFKGIYYHTNFQNPAMNIEIKSLNICNSIWFMHYEIPTDRVRANVVWPHNCRSTVVYTITWNCVCMASTYIQTKFAGGSTEVHTHREAGQLFRCDLWSMKKFLR